MVSRQQAADRFAHDIIGRMRGEFFTPATAAQVKSAVDERTRPDNGPVHDVMALLRGQTLEPAEALAIAEFVGSITKGTPAPAYRRLGDNPQA